MTDKQYTTEDAFKAAIEWCAKNPGWQRICDIEDSDSLYFKFEELPKKEQAGWKKDYPGDYWYAWREFGCPVCKVKNGHVSGAGVFYDKITDVPSDHGMMMVFKVGDL